MYESDSMCSELEVLNRIIKDGGEILIIKLNDGEILSHVTYDKGRTFSKVSCDRIEKNMFTKSNPLKSFTYFSSFRSSMFLDFKQKGVINENLAFLRNNNENIVHSCNKNTNIYVDIEKQKQKLQIPCNEVKIEAHIQADTQFDTQSETQFEVNKNLAFLRNNNYKNIVRSYNKNKNISIDIRDKKKQQSEEIPTTESPFEIETETQTKERRTFSAPAYLLKTQFEVINNNLANLLIFITQFEVNKNLAFLLKYSTIFMSKYLINTV